MVRNVKYKTIKLELIRQKKTEAKIQKVLQKIRKKHTMQESHRLYPASSCPGTFYGNWSTK